MEAKDNYYGVGTFGRKRRKRMIEKVQRVCDNCGKIFKGEYSKIEPEKVFCSVECCDLWKNRQSSAGIKIELLALGIQEIFRKDHNTYTEERLEIEKLLSQWFTEQLGRKCFECNVREELVDLEIKSGEEMR